MAETIIGGGIVVDGEITGTEAITVSGIVRGKIAVKDSVLVDSSGRVEADVEAHSMELEGTVEGNVTATDKVEIKAGGRLIGDIKAPRILIADGAKFKGNINMQG